MNINKQYLKCSTEDCFINNRFQNNFAKGIVDHVSYRDLSIEQRPEVLEKFEKLIFNYLPARIIEIGTFAGGLTLILKDIVDYYNLFTEIYTYDINTQFILNQHVQLRDLQRLFVYTKNLFNNQYDSFISEQVQQEIRNLIQQPGPTLLLCDGGCKKCEFNILSNCLKTKDIIMAHDYAPNKEYFEQNMKDKIWNWHEIQDSDIIESCQKYGLVPYMREDFLSVAWACFKKE